MLISAVRWPTIDHRQAAFFSGIPNRRSRKMLPDKYRKPAKPGQRKSRPGLLPALRVVIRFNPDAVEQVIEMRTLLESLKHNVDPTPELQEDQQVPSGKCVVDMYLADGSFVLGVSEREYLQPLLEVFFMDYDRSGVPTGDIPGERASSVLL
jgi:hypothetical protein